MAYQPKPRIRCLSCRAFKLPFHFFTESLCKACRNEEVKVKGESLSQKEILNKVPIEKEPQAPVLSTKVPEEFLLRKNTKDYSIKLSSLGNPKFTKDTTVNEIKTLLDGLNSVPQNSVVNDLIFIARALITKIESLV